MGSYNQSLFAYKQAFFSFFRRPQYSGAQPKSRPSENNKPFLRDGRTAIKGTPK
ncbi:hypothetical protein NEIELOOT_02608 [Neisseria elongata subsp. glycolytica ATCC 29315]|uniref:Uncharacterized protein n=1 Tax=Neisseria elongata subsp. glycolytica ATCC 29315 TaxID=546263 RepID=D4DU51_NEIEG|nr:hypothetical protein NEIELOOT_02608 [Neisseria elongata subsp. glycolytica ATCC 29315]